MKNVKVLVLEGGYNEEHDISLATGKQVKKSLSRLNIEYDSILVSPKNFDRDILNFNNKYICFNALHGTFGEDGQIQKILDNLYFKYTHSNSETSHIGFNKELTKQKASKNEILTPQFLTLDYSDINKKTLIDVFIKFGPFVIKPISSGSSFGVKILNNKKTINFFLKDIKNNSKIYKYHNKLLIEKFIKGRELTVAVIQKNNISIPIEVTEIISGNDFFDYQSKYTSGFSKHILPAKIPKIVYEKCKYQAKLIHDKIGCKGVSRSDFIYDNKYIYFLEINTQPGLTPLSLVPEQLKYQNIFFDELILELIKNVL